MAQLVTVTIRPNATLQDGVSTFTGAINRHSALADDDTGTYITMPNAYVRNEGDRLRVAFPTPTIPAGARVVSVSLRDQVQSATITPAVTWGWLGCRTTDDDAGGSTYEYWRELYSDHTPITTTTEWKMRNPGGRRDKGPDGKPWTSANLSGLFYEIGRGDDGATQMRVAGVWLDVTYQRQSAVTVTGPTTPSTATRPTVSWTFTSPDQQPQAQRRVAIYTATQVGASGFVPFQTEPLQATGARTGTADESYWDASEQTTWTLTGDLVDDTYYAYVQACALWSGQDDFPTEISSISWTRAATPVNPPPAAVLLSASYNTALGLNEAEFEPGGSSPATTAFTVEACRDGLIWVPIPSATRVAADGMNTVTAWDSVAELNVPTKYRVIALNGTTAALSPSNELTVTPVDDRHWLVDPVNPLLSTPIQIKAPEVGQGIEVTRRRMESLYYEVGDENGSVHPPKRIRGPSYGDDYKITLRCNAGEESADYWPKIEQIDRLSNTLMWKRPGEQGTGGNNFWCYLGIGGEAQDTKLRYDMVPGDPQTVAWRDYEVVLTQAPEPAFY